MQVEYGAAFTDDISVTESLRFAVPWHMDELRATHRPGTEVFAHNPWHDTDGIPLYKAVDDARNLGSYGDGLQFSGHGERSPAGRRATTKAFNALARGLAMAAFEPGGVTFAGLHWCTQEHDGCPRPPAPARTPVTAEDIAYVIGLLDEYESWCVPRDDP